METNSEVFTIQKKIGITWIESLTDKTKLKGSEWKKKKKKIVKI